MENRESKLKGLFTYYNNETDREKNGAVKVKIKKNK